MLDPDTYCPPLEADGVTPTNQYLRHGFECVTIDLEDSDEVAEMQAAYEAPTYDYLSVSSENFATAFPDDYD